METRREFFLKRLDEKLLEADHEDPEIAEQLTWVLPVDVAWDAIRRTEGVTDDVRATVSRILEEDLAGCVRQGFIQVLIVRAYLTILLVGDPDRGLQFDDPFTEIPCLMESVLATWRRAHREDFG